MAEADAAIPQQRILPCMIFNTAFPMFQGEPKPLALFSDCSDHKNCKNCDKGHTYCGRVREFGNFDSSHTGVVRLVTEYKIRYAMVLTTSTLSLNTRWLNVVVAPIIGIHDIEADTHRNQQIMNRDIKMFAYYYLGDQPTGMRSCVDLSSLCYVPKQWLGE